MQVATKTLPALLQRAIVPGLAILAITASRGASAQLLTRYLPQSVPGYQLDPTLAVLQNGGPDYTSPGVRLGDFVIRPGIDETFGFNDNPLGLIAARSSPVIGSSGTVSLNSDWSRDSIGASFNAGDLRYTALPIADQTSYSGFGGGRLDIGRDSLDVSAGRVSTYLGPADLLSSGLTAPIPYSSNDIRAAYNALFNRLTLTPSVDLTSYEFGHAGRGVTLVDDAVLDKDQAAAGLTASYELSPGHNLVAAFEQTNAYLLHRAGGAGGHYDDSLILAGLDYATGGAFHYDALLGYEIRSGSGGAQASRQTPAAELSVTWRPTLLTTINAAGIRHLSDASFDIANDLAYSEGKVVVTHELYRNVILNANFDVQAVQGNTGEGGNRTSVTGGGGATYLLDRNVRLNLTYQFSQGNGYNPGVEAAGNPFLASGRSFQANLVQWSVHLGF